MSNTIYQSQPPQAALDKIIGLYNQGHWKESASLAESLSEKYPSSLMLCDILGAAYLALRNAEKAIENYQKALQLNPHHTDAYNNMGMALYDQGRFDEAVESYQKAVEIEPNFADAYYNLGNALKQIGDLKKAIESYRASLAINSEDAEVLSNCGNALKDYGEPDQAIECYAKALKIDPNLTCVQANMDNVIAEKFEVNKMVNSKAFQNYQRLAQETNFEVPLASEPSQCQIQELIQYYNLGKFEVVLSKAEPLVELFPKATVILNIMGSSNACLENYDMALTTFEQALKIKPDDFDVLNNMGNTQKDKGDLNAAIDTFKQALKLKPDNAAVYSNLGVALQKKGDLEAAIYSYKQAIKLEPTYAAAYLNLGNAQYGQQKLNAAVDSYKQAINLEPTYAAAYLNLGNAQYGQQKLNAAVDSYKQAIKLEPAYAEAYNNLGNAQKDTGDLAAAINSCKQAIEIKPDYAEAYSNLGNAQEGKGELDAAIYSYKQAIEIKPDYAEAYSNLGNAQVGKGDLNAAIYSYKQAIKISPSLEAAKVQMLHQQSYICDWGAIEEDRGLIPFLGTLTQYISPFAMLALEDEPVNNLKRAKLYSKKNDRQKLPYKKLSLGQRKEKLKIAYCSGFFTQNPVSILIAKMMELHDRSHFEIFGFYYGKSPSDKYLKRIQAGVDTFVDVGQMTDRNIAKLIHNYEIDIAVDLHGYMEGGRSGILAFRPAPIQINYFGYPGTLGADFIHYIVGDEVVIPENQKINYSENIIYLPNCYMPQDNTRLISNKLSARSDYGLPASGFIFCCFNNSYKISPQEFDIWMRLLTKVKGSVLWLIKSNKWSEANLRREAIKRGVDPNRLVFAEKLPVDEHLGRLKLADLFLDTFNFNAHTSASDALWAGVPVVTKIGKGFAARVAGSLLTAVELPELITTSEEEYEALALSFATDPDKLSRLKKKLAENRTSTPLFDTVSYIKNLEKAYMESYQRYADGLPPSEFKVS